MSLGLLQPFRSFRPHHIGPAHLGLQPIRCGFLRGVALGKSIAAGRKKNKGKKRWGGRRLEAVGEARGGGRFGICGNLRSSADDLLVLFAWFAYFAVEKESVCGAHPTCSADEPSGTDSEIAALRSQ